MKWFILVIFFGYSLFTSLNFYSQKRTYPTGISINNGNVSYCQNSSSTQLTLTLTTAQCGNGTNSSVSHTEKIYVNTVNSTVGGTEVATLTNTLFATNATYTPPTTNTGTLYYYAVVTWSTNGCAIGGSITSSIVSITVLEPNSSLPFSQGFNGSSCGWTTQQVSGTAGTISMVTTSSNETTSPAEGSHFIIFNSFNATPGNSTRLISPSMEVSPNDEVVVSFKLRNSTSSTYSDRLDRVVVQWSINGTTWTDVTTFNRPNTTLNGWQTKMTSFDVGNNTSILIGFRFISEYGYNVAIDDLSFDRIPEPIPLPVELTQFDAVTYPQWNVVKWTTDSEYNSSHFDLEMSTDGNNWVHIFTKQAAGNSVHEIKYSYIDYNISELVYYRLVQYDFDGVYKTYGPISAKKMFVSKSIIGYINLMGQDVDPNNVNGCILEVYSDGSVKKIIK